MTDHSGQTELIEADVAIVGAGPVGLVLSLLLARRGRSVVVIERWPEPYPRPRAVAFDDETARLLQGLGLMPEILKVSTPGGNLYHWWNADGECLLLIDNRGMGRSGWPKKVQFNQPDVEQILLAHARAHPLITLLVGTEVMSVQQDDQGVSLELSEFVGADARGVVAPAVWARYAVGCDGANSVVREHMATELVDLGFFYDWLILDVVPHADFRPDPISLQLCDPKRPTTIIPSGPGRRRWEFMVLPDESVDEMNTEATAWRLLEPWALDASNSRLDRHTVYRFQARWADRWNDRRLLLAGDAAHLMPPFAGQGFCSGMRDAANLAWKLDLVLDGVAEQSLLDSYTHERVQHIQHAIHFSIELGRVICVLDPQEAAERDRRMLAHAGAPEKVLPRLPDAAFDQGVIDPGTVGGTLSPQCEVQGVDGRGLFDDVIGASGALLVRPGAADDVSEQDRAFLARVGIPVVTLLASGVPAVDAADAADAADAVVDVTGEYGDELQRLEADAVLVRPDLFYFGAASGRQGVAAMVTRFRESLLGAREGMSV